MDMSLIISALSNSKSGEFIIVVYWRIDLTFIVRSPFILIPIARHHRARLLKWLAADWGTPHGDGGRSDRAGRAEHSTEREHTERLNTSRVGPYLVGRRGAVPRWAGRRGSECTLGRSSPPAPPRWHPRPQGRFPRLDRYTQNPDFDTATFPIFSPILCTF